MKIFVCNICAKSYCLESEDSYIQCPNCRSEDITTDKCVIASLINYLFKIANKNFKEFLGDKNDK